jgi:hypothetical protein
VTALTLKSQRARRRVDEPDNPWTATTDHATLTPVEDSPAQPEGELTPQPGVSRPAAELRLPWTTLPADQLATPLFVVSAHGGAGGSTIAMLSPGWLAVGPSWPIAPEGEPPVPAIVCARTSYQGLRAAQAALTDWASGSVPLRLEGLVLLAHAPGRLPKQLRPLRELVRGAAAGHVWEIGWQPQWQLAEPAMPRDRRLRDLFDQLTNRTED